jgi:hypothetical protein
MATQVRFSVTGENKKEFRSSIANLLVANGLRRRGSSEFTSENGLSPEQAALIINGFYSEEARFSPIKVVTLLVQSSLIYVEMKRNKYRSI